MSIASRIEAIEQHLEDDYSVLELAGSDLTNVDKNIVNLKPTWKERLLYFINNGTDVVWDNWDKVVGEGTSISLNNTLEAKMKIELKGNTYQDSTTGKNLLPFTNQDFTINNVRYYVQNGSLYINGTSTGETSSKNQNFTDNFSFTLPSGTYTISQNSTVGLYLFDSEGNNILSNPSYISSGTTRTITLENQMQLFFGFYVYQKSFANLNAEVMIEKGSQATSYEPYTNGASPNPDYPQDIHIVSGDNTIKVEGKNMASDKWEDYTYTGNYAIYPITLEQGATYKLSATRIGELKPNYYNYGIVRDGDKYSNFVGLFTIVEYLSGEAKAPMSFTIDSNWTNPKLVCYLGQNNPQNVFNELFANFHIQLEKSNTATSYEPYQSQSYAVNLGTLELCKIGNYQDKFIRNSGKNLLEPSSFAQKVIDSPYSSANASTYNSETGELSIKMGDRSVVFDNFKPNTRYTIILKYNIATNGSNLECWYTDNSYDNITPLAGSGTFIFVTRANKSVASIKHSAYDSTMPRTLYLKESGIFEGVIETTDFEPYGNGDWYLKKETGKVVLDGSESGWNYNGGSVENNASAFTLNINDAKNVENTSSEILVISDNFIGKSATNTISHWVLNTMALISSKRMYLILNRTEFSTDVNLVKTWLGTHNTILYYALLNPTYTKIEGTLESQLNALAKSYEGQTNISQESNDLASVLNASALTQM